MTLTLPIPLHDNLKNKTKENFEIVITRYNEDISWSDNYKNYRTIYNKGKDDLNCECIRVPNMGRDGETVVRHIVTNWDNLADTTFFCQGKMNDRSDQILNDNHINNYINCKTKYAFCLRRDMPCNNERFHKFPMDFSNFYEEVLNKKYTKTGTWVPGMWISASKENIKKTNLEVYKRILDFFNFHKHDAIAYYFERIMYDLF